MEKEKSIYADVRASAISWRVRDIPAEMEKQQKQKDVVVTVPEIPKRGRKQKKKTTEAHDENKTAN